MSDFIIVVHAFVVFVHEDPAADPCNHGVNPKSLLDTNTLSVHRVDFIHIVPRMEPYVKSLLGWIPASDQTLSAGGESDPCCSVTGVPVPVHDEVSVKMLPDLTT